MNTNREDVLSISRRRPARVAGGLYLIVVLTGPIGFRSLAALLAVDHGCRQLANVSQR